MNDQERQSDLSARLRELAEQNIEIGHEIMDKFDRPMWSDGLNMAAIGLSMKRLANDLERDFIEKHGASAAVNPLTGKIRL